MIRTILFWTHLSAGVVAGAIILIMSVTGVALTYEKQMINWADLRQLPAVNAPVTNHLPVDSLLAIATRSRNGQAPTAITVRSDADQPAQVSFGQAGPEPEAPYSAAEAQPSAPSSAARPTGTAGSQERAPTGSAAKPSPVPPTSPS
jgi:uncharacterized iron-regulated membrane protein